MMTEGPVWQKHHEVLVRTMTGRYHVEVTSKTLFTFQKYLDLQLMGSSKVVKIDEELKRYFLYANCFCVINYFKIYVSSNGALQLWI
jgi:hypothetical protein